MAATLLAGSAVTLLVGVAVLVATGHRVMVDMSDSMQPAIAAGDGRTMTHRVVSVRERGDKLAFHTKGDANGKGERWTIAAGGTAGRVQVVIPTVGYVLNWFGRPPVRFVFHPRQHRAGRARARAGLGHRAWTAGVTRLLLSLAAALSAVAIVAAVAGTTFSAFSGSTSSAGNTFAAAASFGGCSSAGTVTASANIDSWIDQASAGSNFGNDQILKLKRETGSKANRALVRFNLPAVLPEAR